MTAEPTDPVEVARAVWERMQDRDWDGARALLADDVDISWPVTGERFDSADAFIAMNRAYPGGWFITVRAAAVADDGDVLLWVEVPFFDTMMWCTQKVTVRDGRVVASIDLWSTENADPAPPERAPFRTSADQLPPAGPPDPTRSVPAPPTEEPA